MRRGDESCFHTWTRLFSLWGSCFRLLFWRCCCNHKKTLGKWKRGLLRKRVIKVHTGTSDAGATFSSNFFYEALVSDRPDVWTDSQVTHEHTVNTATIETGLIRFYLLSVLVMLQQIVTTCENHKEQRVRRGPDERDLCEKIGTDCRSTRVCIFTRNLTHPFLAVIVICRKETELQCRKEFFRDENCCLLTEKCTVYLKNKAGE